MLKFKIRKKDGRVMHSYHTVETVATILYDPPVVILVPKLLRLDEVPSADAYTVWPDASDAKVVTNGEPTFCHPESSLCNCQDTVADPE